MTPTTTPAPARPLVYLASPYTHASPAVRDARASAVCMAAARFARDGHFIYSPIAHSHAIALAGSLPTDWSYWKHYDEAFLNRCNELWVLMLPGWDMSTGVAAETAFAREHGIRVRHVCPTDAEWLTAAGVGADADAGNDNAAAGPSRGVANG
jgi:hypothetical protein